MDRLEKKTEGPKDAGPIHILFYGKKCPHSAKFMKKLTDYPELNVLFRKLPVDDLPTLPPQLTTVPAIVIDNKNMYQGQKAFEWMKENVAMYLSAGPALDPKGGYKLGAACGDIGFSFLGDSSSEYNSGWASLTAKNGSDVDKTKFDQSTGRPLDPSKLADPNRIPSMEELMSRRNQEVPNIPPGGRPPVQRA